MTSNKGSADPLRPATLDDVIGQAEVVETLRVALGGAQARGELPGHMLFGGPAGTGKTTLSLIVAGTVQGRLISLIGPRLRSPKDLIDTLIAARANDVIFIDEIHRMHRPAQEYLLPVMEDGVLADDGPRIQLPPLMFIGATTEPERLVTPMLDRFTWIFRLRLYRVDELALIAKRTAGKLNVGLTDEGAQAIAEAASGVPRVTIRLVKAARDFAYADTPCTSTDPTNHQGDTCPVHEGGMVTIDVDDVRRTLASPALIWRAEGRLAG